MRKRGPRELEPVKPRKCALPGCGVEFTPKKANGKDARFCCIPHKTGYWKLAALVGDRAIRSGFMSAILPPSGISQVGSILARLQENPGSWVSRKAILGGIWNSSRISELRRRGFKIQSCYFGRDIQYRLVIE